jgi:hypothetical protein
LWQEDVEGMSEGDASTPWGIDIVWWSDHREVSIVSAMPNASNMVSKQAIDG